MRFSRILVVAMVFGLALFSGSSQVAHGAAIIKIDTTADSGASNCTLREAIIASNTDAAVDGCTAGTGVSDTIDFSLAGSGTLTFTFSSALPTITDPVLIDGATATSYAGVGTPPVIVLDGTGLPAATDGLKITAGGSTVKALAIVKFPGDGIELATGSANLVIGNHIGMDPDGTTVKGNGANGILIVGSASNVIGSLASGGNLISGNVIRGVAITGETSDLNVVKFNIIGLDISATVKKGNSVGVRIEAGADLNEIGAVGGEGNIISGNVGGVEIIGSGTTGNVVAYNAIGTNAVGGAGLGNGGEGVHVDGAPSNTVGPSNLISGNGIEGVEIEGSTAILNTVLFNHIGVNVAGDAALANSDDGVSIRAGASSNTIGPGNVISGNSGDGVGIESSTATLNVVKDNRIGTNAADTAAIANGLFGVNIDSAPSNTIGPGNIISGNTFRGVEITGSTATLNTVLSNKIGTNSLGTVAIPNETGVVIFLAPSNTVGPDNVISGNTGDGVVISGAAATLNTVKDNKIGTNSLGATALANSRGVVIASAPSNTIGPGNVISGNTAHGVRIEGTATLNTVTSNKIGVNLAGDTAIPNTLNGVLISGAPSNTIGPGNVISGNTSDGVRLSFAGATLNTVAGNHIGVNLAGDTGIPNGSQGVEITGPSNTIGPSNVISGNTSVGVIISGASATLNVVKDNKIGTNLAGTTAIANLGGGVFISVAPSNTIGPGNVISGNTLDGVFINGAAATGNTVSGNKIGTNAAGTTAVANLERGVRIFGAPSNTIGPDNVISGNTLSGLAIDGVGATSNTVSDNKIGTNLAGTAAIANVLAGVFITGGAPSNTIGPDNVIAFNTLDGVRINGAGTTGNTVTGNSIHDNTALGINNVSGGNTELTPPTVTAAGSASGSSDCSSCTIEVFSDDDDEGEIIHDTTTTAGGACPCAWSIAGAVTGPNITATVTDGSGNTSEFSVVPFVADTDGDGQLDAVDACPTISTVWPTPIGDPDCDGFLTTLENFLGTDPLVACAANATPNNESPDKWPVDIDDNRVVTTADVGFYVTVLNEIGPNPPNSSYIKAMDLNMDIKITTADVGFFVVFLNKMCPS